MKDFTLSIPDIAALVTTFCMHVWLYRMLHHDAVHQTKDAVVDATGVRSWKLLRWIPILSGFFSAAGLLMQIRLVWSVIPPGDWFTWGRGASIVWAIVATGTIIAYGLSRYLRQKANPWKSVQPERTHAAEEAGRAATETRSSIADRPQAAAPATQLSPDPVRRNLLKAAHGALIAGPSAVTAFGVLVGRHELEPKEVVLDVPNLPKDLDGLRIAQLSDIHLSAFVPRAMLDRAVAMANSFRPHLHVVTGDLITREGDPLDSCLAGLKALRSDAGVFGCMGNHERYADAEDYVADWGKRNGMPFLRSEQLLLRFGQAQLNLAGVDYQKMHGEYLVGSQAMLQKDAFNLLLSHNPDVFPVAAQQGWDLTLSGHTHGGQITVEYLDRYINVVRFLTPFVSGHYQIDKSQLYVTRGIGTVGVPARVGANPEVTLLRLRSV